MSRLFSMWNAEVTVFPEVQDTDKDGNVRTRASKTGFPAKASIYPLNQSGTAARRAEQDNEGFETETVLRMRLVGEHRFLVLGAQSVIEWDGARWSVFGDVIKQDATPRTAHYLYTLRRS